MIPPFLLYKRTAGDRTDAKQPFRFVQTAEMLLLLKRHKAFTTSAKLFCQTQKECPGAMIRFRNRRLDESDIAATRALQNIQQHPPSHAAAAHVFSNRDLPDKKGVRVRRQSVCADAAHQ